MKEIISPFYLPARIPRGFAPGMNGGESNFSDRGAFSEASEYLEALPRGSLFDRLFIKKKPREKSAGKALRRNKIIDGVT